MKRPLIFLGLLAATGLVYWLFRHHPPTLEMLRAELEGLAEWRADRPLVAAMLFFFIYVLVAALSLPLGIWMTLLAGGLFGFWQGLVIVSFASSIGATLAFLVARFLLRDWVKERFGHRLAALDEGIARDGAFYLFTLRLLPVVPFFLVNLLMALTPLPAAVFYAVSQAGMLAATAIYVNAGTQIGSLTSLGDILSPGLLLSFAALGLLPWGARLLVGRLGDRRLYARWRRPARFDRNLIVIGGGSAGLVAAYIAAAAKAKVTLIEAGEMGGDCLNTGCVPSKALIRSAKLAQQMRHADRYGLTPVAPEVRFREVFARVSGVIAAIAPHDSVERYEGLGVEVMRGRGRLVDPWTVEIAGLDGGTRTLTTRATVIATGAVPQIPPLPGLDGIGALTSETLWAAMAARERAPERLVILGGGPVGCELAQSFARLGAGVTLVEMAPRLLPREDEAAALLIRQVLEREGVEVLTGFRAAACGQGDSGKWIEVADETGSRRIGFDEIIVATGRAARLEGFGLEELGIATGRTIATNAFLQTSYPNILAAGDVAGPWQLTNAAAHQAWFAAMNGLFGRFRRFRFDDRVLPRTTFTDPELAQVGLTEAEARTKGIAVEVTRYALSGLDRAIADGAAEGFVKVLTPPGKDRILGVTIVGAGAGEMVAEFALAMRSGLGLGRILGTVHSYPTLAEANKAVAGVWRRAHLDPRALRLLERFHAWQRG